MEWMKVIFTFVEAGEVFLAPKKNIKVLYGPFFKRKCSWCTYPAVITLGMESIRMND